MRMWQLRIVERAHSILCDVSVTSQPITSDLHLGFRSYAYEIEKEERRNDRTKEGKKEDIKKERRKQKRNQLMEDTDE